VRGKVRWFNNGIGWGRIRGENGKDYHCHFANIVSDGCGFRTLAPEEEVEFRIVQRTDGKIAEAVEIKRFVLTPTPIDPIAPIARFEKNPWTIKIDIEKDGRVFFPQLTQSHPRDYMKYHVSAHYLGHPGSFEQHNSFEVSMPWEEVTRGIYVDMAIYLTNEEGGVIHDRAKPNFKPGNYVVSVQVIDNNVIVCAQKIGLRTQDSRNVVHPEDKGVWLVLETVYGGGLEIPEYDASEKKAEQELKKKIEALIPAEFEWATADNRKFAKVIAAGILAIRNF